MDKKTGEPLGCIEWCVSPELLELWQQGIQTVCSCCGHGKDEESYIRVRDEYADAMRALGYERYEPHECVIYRNSAAFRAKNVRAVREERKKDKPEEPVNIELIRLAWAKSAGVHTKEMYENV